MRIERRKNNRLASQHPEIFGLHWHGKNVLRLTGAPIEPRQLTADDDVWIEGIGNDVTIFLRRNWSPVAKRDSALVAAAFDSDRAALLLTAVKPIRKRVVGAHMVQLGGRLVVPRAPALSAVHGDN